MDYDHRPGTKKKFNVSVIRKGKAEILKEIEKCDLVCANCHRIRTHNRRFASKALKVMPLIRNQVNSERYRVEAPDVAEALK